MQKLQDWVNENTPDDKMIYKEAAWHQIMFIRDKTRKAFLFDDSDAIKDYQDDIMVVGSHTSKSITLPVYRLFWNGITFYIRDNFHGWVVSVDSEYVILGLAEYDLFPLDYTLNKNLVEGFNSEWVFESYLDNQRRFTVECYDTYGVFCLLKAIAVAKKSVDKLL